MQTPQLAQPFFDHRDASTALSLDTLKHDGEILPMLPTLPTIHWHYPSLPAWQLTNPIISQTPPDIEARPDGEPVEDVLLADPELKRPSLYAVVIFNDDYTPMDFVVAVLQDHFKHDLETAVNIMLAVHHQGKGIAGIYPKDIAETKAQQVNREARQAGFPLLAQIEEQPQG